jgi:(4S)-4-hydroxy-5-phosphonooxypentane-2,3-dione isomerase
LCPAFRTASAEPDSRSRNPVTEKEHVMSKVSLVARIEAKDGKADELVAAFDKLLAEVAKEPGTIHYVLHKSTTDPNALYVTEIYEDQAALDAHMGSDHFKSFGAGLADLVNGADLQFLTPVSAAKGLDL